MPLEMNPNHAVPLVFRHIGQGAVAQDARIIHQHVQIAERRNRQLDHLRCLFPVRHVMTADDSTATP
jgi:hypothetical protein